MERDGLNCGDIPLTLLHFSKYNKKNHTFIDGRQVVATMGTDPDFPPNKADQAFNM